jgi:hypothetical protein
MDIGSFCAVEMLNDNATDQTFIVSVVADLPWQSNITGERKHYFREGDIT